MRFWFHTFGCRVNQYETQVVRERMLAVGSLAVSDWESADLCLINTCTVTQEADRDALRLLRRIARRNPAARLVVTGCLASRDPQAILEAAPSALVVGNEGKEELPSLLGCSSVPAFAGVSAFCGHTRAFLKVQDGCNMRCGFCIIPSVRPVLWSKPIQDLEAEARRLVAAGYREIVPCGVRLGRYLALEGGGRVDFAGMLERLLGIPGDFRIRLSSLEITDLTDRLIALMAGSGGRLCPSLHIPLQSGSEGVLRRMRRWYSAAFYARRVEALRSRLPEAGVFADVMTGFPGETEAEFLESRAFIEGLGFSGLHVFRYSKRAGTQAARNPGQLPERVVLERARALRDLDRSLRAAFAARAVGSWRRVLMKDRGPAPEGLAENFLCVRLPEDPGPGFHRVRVERSAGPLACGLLDPKGPGRQEP